MPSMSPGRLIMSLTDALDRYFAAWNDHDPDAVVRSLASGGSYEDATTGRPLTGDALAANVAALLAGFPDLHSTWSARPPPATPRPPPSG
jgi:hypothetical protein